MYLQEKLAIKVFKMIQNIIKKEFILAIRNYRLNVLLRVLTT